MNEEITKKTIIGYLADHLGVEPDDIKLEDQFSELLHMNAAQIIDFMKALEGKGVDVSDVELETTKTVGELLDALNVTEE